MTAAVQPPPRQPPGAMETTIIDPLASPQWDTGAGSHPECTIFHTTAWARVLAKTYGHRPVFHRCAAAGRNAAFVPMLEVRSILTERRGVCVPFSDSCAPLTGGDCDSEPLIQALLATARAKKWSRFEIRGLPGKAPSHEPSVEFLGHTLSLGPDITRLQKKFSSPVRRAIRKAERHGLEVAISTEPGAVRDYHRLHCHTRRRHGVPPQPLSFFLNIHAEIIASGSGFVVLARDASRPVAGAVFLRHGKRACYKFGASIDEGRDARANNLVMWEAIQKLAGDGCESLDFGRTSPGNLGLRRFKLGWGATEHRLPYYTFDTATGRSIATPDRASGAHTAVFSRLPVLLNRAMGALIYPHLD